MKNLSGIQPLLSLVLLWAPTLLHAATVPIDPGETVTGVLALGATNTYSFTGTSGEVVNVWMVKTGGSGINPTVELYDPNGAAVVGAVANVSAVSSLIQAQALTKTGTYTIVCRDDVGNETYPYSVTLVKLPGGANPVDPGDLGGSILPGQTLTNLLGQVADIDTFTFVGTAGEV